MTSGHWRNGQKIQMIYKGKKVDASYFITYPSSYLVNEYEWIPDKPVIYACNHSQFSDIPIATRAIGKRSYILLGKQKLYLIDRIFFHLLGAIWVDRKDKEHKKKVKE